MALAFIVFALAACPRSVPPAPPERPPPGCTDLARNDMPRNDMPRNDMPRNDMPRNGLTGAALKANQPLLQKLAERPFQQALDESIASGAIPLATANDPYATRKLLKYIAACALDPCEEVSAGTASNPIKVYGELGLCGETYNARSGKERPWRQGPPTEGCKQRVSACVLARVNAVGASVRLSMRGDGLHLADQVGVDTIFRENHGTDIVSFKTCQSRKITSHEPSRNCDWVPRNIGRCVPGDVTIRAAGRIRVCAGVYGCDDTIKKDVTPLVDAMTGAPRTSPPRYGGAMLASGADSVTIQCPTNGPILQGKQTGYFAVMIDAAQPQVSVSQTQDPLAEYPASEAATFTYREGAFYGDIFAPRPVESSPDRILWNDQYACYSDVWTLSAALLADRLCANVTAAKCFGNTPEPCVDRCTALAGDPRVEDTCSPPPPTKPGPPPKAFEPFTVYLNHPCDLASDYDRCITLTQHTPHN